HFAREIVVSVLTDRYQHRRDEADLLTARRLRDSAREPLGAEDVPGWDPEALRHFTAFRQHQDPHALDEAIGAQKATLDAAAGTAQRAMYSYLLGYLYFVRYFLYRERRNADLTQAVDLIRAARTDWTEKGMVSGSGVMLARLLIQRHMRLGAPAD